MRKEQTFISYLENSEGKMLDFERWACKKSGTVLKKAKELYQHMNNYGWYQKDVLEKAECLAIYATPDGCSRAEVAIARIPIAEILSN